jgi:tripartite-type tricarboxylate transporter receptor subunit TctC
MKKLITLLFAGVLATASIAAKGPAANDSAANWPKQPINLIVAFAAGGNSDYNARAIAKYLGKELGRPVVVTNVAGSGGSIGSAQVKNAKPDGYTILVNQLSINMAQVCGIVDFGYADFAPVCVFSRSADEVLVVNASAPWKTFDDMIADTKKNPGKFKITANTGASTQWIAVGLKNAGAEFNTVSSGGSGERLTLLLGKHVDVIPMPWNMVEDYVKTNQFKVLATVSPERSAHYPDVPTLKEKGVNCSYYYNNTFFMPKGTDPAIVEKFSKACEKIITTNSDYRKECAGFSQEPVYMNTEQTAAYYKTELENLMAIQNDIRGTKK